MDVHKQKTVKQILKSRGILMLVAMGMCTLFALSLLINPIFNFFVGNTFDNEFIKNALQVLLNFCILFVLFTGMYFITPTKKKRLRDCAQMSLLTSAAFLFGNILIGLYMKNFALNSLYGAAGALLIFLLWTFYSSLTLFMSVEVFEFLKRKKT